MLRKGIEWILLTTLLIGTLFCTSRYFVEKELLPKEGVFIFLSFLLGGVSLVSMDKKLIEEGFVTKAKVKWYGGVFASPYLWKEDKR